MVTCHIIAIMIAVFVSDFYAFPCNRFPGALIRWLRYQCGLNFNGLYIVLRFLLPR
ncbi:hypothetical protein BJV82DRAFT_587638 [Fennellomyces sp. T-0311]|nr:hypothetical protein BJV82DRAFT_587638 [Fennellomyces sp. T-0311]